MCSFVGGIANLAPSYMGVSGFYSPYRVKFSSWFNLLTSTTLLMSGSTKAASMSKRVISPVQYFKVIRGIVQLVSVLVMDVLIGSKVATKHGLHDVAVLTNAAAISINLPIASVDIAPMKNSNAAFGRTILLRAGWADWHSCPTVFAWLHCNNVPQGGVSLV
jgi:hypothetical protein